MKAYFLSVVEDLEEWSEDITDPFDRHSYREGDTVMLVAGQIINPRYGDQEIHHFEYLISSVQQRDFLKRYDFELVLGDGNILPGRYPIAKMHSGPDLRGYRLSYEKIRCPGEWSRSGGAADFVNFEYALGVIISNEYLMNLFLAQILDYFFYEEGEENERESIAEKLKSISKRISIYNRY